MSVDASKLPLGEITARLEVAANVLDESQQRETETGKLMREAIGAIQYLRSLCLSEQSFDALSEQDREDIARSLEACSHKALEPWHSRYIALAKRMRQPTQQALREEGSLAEELVSRLSTLPVVTFDNGYLVQALPKAELLAILAQHGVPVK